MTLRKIVLAVSVVAVGLFFAWRVATPSTGVVRSKPTAAVENPTSAYMLTVYGTHFSCNARASKYNPPELLMPCTNQYALFRVSGGNLEISKTSLVEVEVKPGRTYGQDGWFVTVRFAEGVVKYPVYWELSPAGEWKGMNPVYSSSPEHWDFIPAATLNTHVFGGTLPNAQGDEGDQLVPLTERLAMVETLAHVPILR